MYKFCLSIVEKEAHTLSQVWILCRSFFLPKNSAFALMVLLYFRCSPRNDFPGSPSGFPKNHHQLKIVCMSFKIKYILKVHPHSYWLDLQSLGQRVTVEWWLSVEVEGTSWQSGHRHRAAEQRRGQGTELQSSPKFTNLWSQSKIIQLSQYLHK